MNTALATSNLVSSVSNLIAQLIDKIIDDFYAGSVIFNHKYVLITFLNFEWKLNDALRLQILLPHHKIGSNLKKVQIQVSKHEKY